MESARFVVRGKVQGVWFRASTREQARALQLRGFARNLPDGSVEVFAVGESRSLDELEVWLRLGPPLARVMQVSREPAVGDHDVEGFEIR